MIGVHTEGDRANQFGLRTVEALPHLVSPQKPGQTVRNLFGVGVSPSRVVD